MKKRYIVLYSIVVLGLCGSSGFIYSMLHGSGGTSSAGEYGDPKLENKYIDIPSEKVDALIEKEDYQTILYAASSQFKNSKHVSSKSSNLVEADVMGIPYNQEVSSRRVINDKDIFFETNTISAFVKKSEQRYVNPNSYLVRIGENPTIDGANYSSSQVQALTKQAYYERYGHDNSDLFNYVINDYSYKSGKYVGFEDGLYTFEYVLDPDYATAMYKREVAYMGGSKSYPVYSNVGVSISIDENYVVKSITTNDNYTMPIMGGLNCSGTSSEFFTYSQTEIDVPEKKDFEPYFGTSGEVSEEEKTGFDYLQDAFSNLLASNPINLDIDLNIDNQLIKAYAQIDLVNMSVKLDIADLIDIYYLDNNVYVLTSSSSFLVPKDELDGLLKEVLNIDSFDVNDVLSNLLTNPSLGSMLEDMEVSKNENYIDLSLKLGQDNQINIHLTDPEQVKLTSIDADFKYQDHTINLIANLTSTPHTYLPIPNKMEEVNNLASLANKVKNLTTSNSIVGKLNFETSINVNSKNIPVSLTGEYIVDISNIDSVKYQIDLICKINNDVLNFVIFGDDTSIYFYYNEQIKLHGSYQEIYDLINRYIDLSSLDIEQINITNILNLLVNLIDNLHFYQDSIQLGLSSLAIPYLDGQLSISYKDDLTLSYDNLNVSLIPSDSTLDIVKFNDGINIDDIGEYINLLNEYSKGKISANIDNLVIDNLALSGNVNLDFSNKEDILASGNLSIIYKNLQVNLNFYYLGKKIYLEFNDNFKIYMSIEDLNTLIAKIDPNLDLDDIFANLLNQFSLDDISIKKILDSISISSDSISLPLASINSDLNYIVSINKNNQIYLKDSLRNIVTIKTNPTLDISNFDSSKYINFSSVTNSILDLTSYLVNKDLSLDFTTSLKAGLLPLKITANLTYKQIDVSNYVFSLRAKMLTLVDFVLDYDGSYYYLSLNKSYLKLTKPALLNLISQLEAGLGIQGDFINILKGLINSGLNSLSNIGLDSLFNSNTIIDLNEILSSISSKNDKTSLELDISNFNLPFEKISVEVDNLKSKVNSISLSNIKLNDELSLTNTSVSNFSSYYSIDLDKSLYSLDLSSLENLTSLPSVINMVENGCFNINFRQDLCIQDFIIKQGSNLYIDLSNLELSSLMGSKIEDVISKISLNGLIKLEYLGIDLSFNVSIVNSQIQIKLVNNDNLIFGGTYQELTSFINSILTLLNKPTIEFPSEIPELDIASIIKLLPYLNTFSLNDYVEYFNIDSNSIINIKLNIDGEKISINIDTNNIKVVTSSYGSYYLESTAKIEDSSNLLLGETNSHFSALEANLDSIEKLINERKFNGTINLTNLDINIVNLLNQLGIQINLDDDVSNLLLDLSLIYNIDLENKFDFDFTIKINLHTKDGNIKVYANDIRLVKIDTDIYFKLSNIVSKLTYEEWIDTIIYLSNSLNLNLNVNKSEVMDYLSNLDLGLDNFIDFINNKDLDINVDLSNLLSSLDINSIISNLSYDEQLGVISTSVNLNKLVNNPYIGFSSTNINLIYNLNDDRISSTGLLDLVFEYGNEIEIKPINSNEYVTKSDLYSFVDKIKSIINFVSSKQISINLDNSTNLNSVSKDGNLLYDFSGGIYLDRSEGLKLHAKNIQVNQYEENQVINSHNIDLMLTPSYIYNGNKYEENTISVIYNSSLKGYISQNNLLTSANYLLDLLGINNPIVSKLLEYLGSQGSIDASIFDQVFDEISLPKIDINLDTLINKVKADSQNNLRINLDASSIYKALYGDSFLLDDKSYLIDLVLEDDSNSLTKLTLQNMYSSSNEVFNISLDLSNQIEEENLIESSPDLSNYFDLNNLPTLLEGFINDANLRNYHVKGKINANFISIVNIDINFDMYVTLDTYNRPSFAVKFTVSPNWIASGFLSGGTTYMSYTPSDNLLYFNRNNSTYKTYSLDSSDPTYAGKGENLADIINLILNSKSLIAGIVNSNVTNPSTSNINIATILKSYSYSLNENRLSNNIVVDGSQLMSSLGDANLTINMDKLNLVQDKQDYYITNLTLSTKLASVLNVSVNADFADIGSIFDKVSPASISVSQGDWSNLISLF